MQNGYKPPESSLRSGNSLDENMYKVSGVGIATFVGGVLAGGWLLSKNFRVLGQEEMARKVLIYSVVALAGLIAIALALPESWGVPNVVFLVPQIVVMHQYAKQHQGPGIQAHVAKGGRLASNWRALGIGLLVMLAMVAAIIAVVSLLA